MTQAHPAPAAPAPPESVLWEGHTSQWVHFWFYLFCLILAVGCLVGAAFTGGLAAIGLVVPFGMWIIRWWATKTTRYELTTQRLRITSGILSRRLDELELYRVKDYSMDQPFLLRVLNLGNLVLLTSDVTTPSIAIKAIANVTEVREKVRTAVQTERDRKKVRELDLDNPGEGAFA